MDQLPYYLATLVVFFFINNILTWGLNIQFGYAGILDFTYITFFALGGYFTGVGLLGPATVDSGQTYIFGLGWPFILSLLMGAVAAAVLGFLIGLVALRRLRDVYLAIVTVSVGSIAYDFIGTNHQLFNGWDGIVGVPSPFNTFLKLDLNTYTFFYIAVAAVPMIVLWVIANRLYASQLGRTLRAIREDSEAAEAFGKNVFRFRMIAMVIGCIYAGIGGGLAIGYISSLDPGGWTTNETFIIWAALLIGGRANNWGAVLGTLLVPIIFVEATRFLPSVPGHPELIAAVRNIVIGALLILVLRFRPQGILPEPRRRFFDIPIARLSRPEGQLS